MDTFRGPVNKEDFPGLFAYCNCCHVVHKIGNKKCNTSIPKYERLCELCGVRHRWESIRKNGGRRCCDIIVDDYGFIKAKFCTSCHRYVSRNFQSHEPLECITCKEARERRKKKEKDKDEMNRRKRINDELSSFKAMSEYGMILRNRKISYRDDSSSSAENEEEIENQPLPPEKQEETESEIIFSEENLTSLLLNDSTFEENYILCFICNISLDELSPSEFNTCNDCNKHYIEFSDENPTKKFKADK